MKNLILISSIVFSLLFSIYSCTNNPASSSGSTVTNTSTANTDLLFVKYHADWCGSCKALTPLLAELNGKLSDKKTTYVELDFTNEETTEAAKVLAAKLGISGLVAEKQKTGYVAIIDANTKKEMSRLSKKQSVEEMYKQVVSSL